jgi:hypothetical protein
MKICPSPILCESKKTFQPYACIYFGCDRTLSISALVLGLGQYFFFMFGTLARYFLALEKKKKNRETMIYEWPLW